MLALAMVLALGAMGVTYSAWVDEIYIEGTVYTGTIDTTLECGTLSPISGETYITCVNGTPMTLTISVENPQPETHYHCNFTVYNTGSLPIKIDTMNLSGTYSGVTSAIENLPLGTVIDPGLSDTGKVHVYVGIAGTTETTLPFTLAVTVVLWNE